MNDDKPKPKSKAQVWANENQNRRRKGLPSFSAIRFDWLDEEKLIAINETIALYGSNRKNALVAAFKLLQKDLESKEKK